MPKDTMCFASRALTPSSGSDLKVSSPWTIFIGTKRHQATFQVRKAANSPASYDAYEPQL